MQSLTLLFGQRILFTVSSSVNLLIFEVGMLLAFIPHPISLFPELFSISLNGSGVLGSHLQLVTTPPRAPTPYSTVYQLCTPFVYIFLINGTPSTCLVWSTTSLLANKIPSFFIQPKPEKCSPFGQRISCIGHYRGVARGGSRGTRDPPLRDTTEPLHNGHLGDRRKWPFWRDGRYGEVEML